MVMVMVMPPVSHFSLFQENNYYLYHLGKMKMTVVVMVMVVVDVPPPLYLKMDLI
jgi:hypothetical protein